MRPEAAAALAQALMAEWGLVDGGWRFEFDAAESRFGQCDWGRRAISLSRTLVGLNDVEHVEETIKHEIAHALAGPHEGHGRGWEMQCARVGIAPNRCYDVRKVVEPPFKWRAWCSYCEKVRAHRRTLFKESMHRFSCRACGSRLEWQEGSWER